MKLKILAVLAVLAMIITGIYAMNNKAHAEDEAAGSGLGLTVPSSACAEELPPDQGIFLI